MTAKIDESDARTSHAHQFIELNSFVGRQERAKFSLCLFTTKYLLASRDYKDELNGNVTNDVRRTE